MVRAILVPRSEFVQYRALRALRGPALDFERHLAGDRALGTDSVSRERSHRYRAESVSRSVVPEGLPTIPPECGGCEHSLPVGSHGRL